MKAIKSKIKKLRIFRYLLRLRPKEITLRFRDRTEYLRRRYFRELQKLSAFIVRNEIVGGCFSDNGDFYLKTPDGIFLFYNFRYDFYNFTGNKFTLGDGQGLDFRSAHVTLPLENFLMRYLVDWMVYLDVGTNNGYYYALKVAKRFQNAAVYAFEPDARILYHLRKNVQFNALHNVVVVPRALADHVGPARMTAYLGASNFLVLDDATSLITVETECTMLDTFVAENNITKIDLIKVDIEGGEHNFLKGARGSLIKFNPIMILELNDDLLKRSKSSAEEVIAFLVDLNYRCFRVRNTKDALAVPIGKIDAIKENDWQWLEEITVGGRPQ